MALRLDVRQQSGEGTFTSFAQQPPDTDILEEGWKQSVECLLDLILRHAATDQGHQAHSSWNIRYCDWRPHWGGCAGLPWPEAVEAEL